MSLQSYLQHFLLPSLLENYLTAFRISSKIDFKNVFHNPSTVKENIHTEHLKHKTQRHTQHVKYTGPYVCVCIYFYMLHMCIYSVLNMPVIKTSEGKCWSRKHLSAQKTLCPLQHSGNRSRVQVTATGGKQAGGRGALAVAGACPHSQTPWRWHKSLCVKKHMYLKGDLEASEL